MIGLDPWNLKDKDVFREFCNGIFEFKIPQYTETLPIRLVTYFYPDFFIPISKLHDLEIVCRALGMEMEREESKGDKLFAYNQFLADKMRVYPSNNYIKSDVLYKLLFVIELYNGLESQKEYEELLNSYSKNWKKNLIRYAKEVLIKLSLIKL